MNKQQQTALNMARFIKSQSLTLLEKLDALDADEQATLCERLHELAEELCDSVQTHFEAQTARNHKGAGESGRGLSVSVFASRQARRARQAMD
ncbi:Regulatory protein rop (modular protein) [Escherichia coli]|nr:Regulatory protein rop (modular protein) [Escherichia coli]